MPRRLPAASGPLKGPWGMYVTMADHIIEKAGQTKGTAPIYADVASDDLCHAYRRLSLAGELQAAD